MNEKEWQAQVIEAAHLFGWIIFHPFDSRRSNPGFPDLVMARPPRLIFAELKTEKGRVSPMQDAWLRVLNLCPGETYLWRPDDWPLVEAALR